MHRLFARRESASHLADHLQLQVAPRIQLASQRKTLFFLFFGDPRTTHAVSSIGAAQHTNLAHAATTATAADRNATAAERDHAVQHVHPFRAVKVDGVIHDVDARGHRFRSI